VLRSKDVQAAPDATLQTVAIPGPAGRLEGLLRSPAVPEGAAVVAHPHPRHGGTMHTKVVHRAAKLLSDRFALAALRFNFRGVGSSAGAYDDGAGETDDLVAAGQWLRAREADGPLVVGGFSFGSLCALRAAPRLAADVLFLIGVPTDRWTGGEGPAPARRVVWIQGDADEFSRPETARAIAATRGWDVLVVPGADHFFAGKLDEFEKTAGDALEGALTGL
jgi:hypothetical protein